jgi:sugar phosphate isomerase/epimerase
MVKGLSTHLFVAQRLTVSLLERIEKAGIGALEIFCARQHFDYRDRNQVREIAAWFSDSETLRLRSIHAPMYRDDSWGKSGPQSVVSIAETEKVRRIGACEEIKRALELAEYVPFRYMVTHVGQSDEEFDEGKREAAFSSVEHLRMFARQRGVDVLLENIPNELSTPDRLLEFIRYTHMTDLGLCFDAGHANLAEGVAASFEKMRERVRGTHLHDNFGQKDEHLFPFQGCIDWKRTLGDLRGLSRQNDIPLVLEIRENPEIKDPLAQAAEVFHKFQELEAGMSQR